MIAPRHSRLIRSALLFLVSGALALAVAACGQASPARNGHSGSGTTSSGPPNKGVAYASCMRSHGISNFPDPTPAGSSSLNNSGGASITMKVNGQTLSFNLSGIDTSSPQFQAAQKACGSKLGILGSGQSSSPTQSEQKAALQFSACMRSHGIPKFPDPSFGSSGSSGASGGGPVLDINGATFNFSGTGIDPRSSQFQAAFHSCQSMLQHGSSSSGAGQ